MARWPIIRHIRYFVGMVRVNRHYDMWLRLGCLPVHADRDYAVLAKIWKGEA
jgi:hypothetical protein